MREIVFTRRFERDFRRLKRKLRPHDLDFETLEYIFALLQTAEPLPDVMGTHRNLFRRRIKR